MNKLLHICILLISSISFSQSIKISSGIFYSNLKINDNKILKNKEYIPLFLGIDYFQKKNYFLSSNIGLLKIKGEEQIIHNNEINNVKETLNVVNFNTTFNYKLNLDDNNYLFIGLGPKIDFLLDNSLENKVFQEISDLPTVFWGYKLDLGFNYPLNKNFDLGLNFNYMNTFKSMKNNIEYNYDNYGLLIYVKYNL
ncbi:outer membrane beta-barrel protein [Empedobacter falsenii]